MEKGRKKEREKGMKGEGKRERRKSGKHERGKRTRNVSEKLKLLFTESVSSATTTRENC